MVGTLLRWIGILIIVTMVAVVAIYLIDMNRAYARISGKTTVIPSDYGNIEYSEGGTGQPVLVIHGSGGGYDQGEILVEAVLGDDFHWITPSRYGYLRSTYHAGATFDDQAHAYAALLDHLGIDKTAVVALSHGGPSALLFAALYPERVSSLTLISCGVASSTVADQAQANQKGDMLVTIYKYDPLYWAFTKLFRNQFMELMGANQAAIVGLTPEQRVLIDEVIDYMNPVSRRAAGVAFDNKAKLPNERIEAIQTPTIIFHAKDDGLQLYHNAEFAAAHIPGAKLVSYERGGHLLMIVERADIQSQMHKHILEHVSE